MSCRRHGQTIMPDAPAKKHARLLRITGASVLVLGLVTAGVIYGVGLCNAKLNNDPSMLGFNRAEQRQMGQLYGKSGQMVDDWMDDLKQPGTQAVLISIASVLIAAGCFYFARLVEVDDGPAGQDGATT
jgi:hypothetical protein